MSGFKFDFSPSAEGGGGDNSAPNPSCDTQSSRLVSDANELIAKLIERSKRNASASTLVNASSKILSADNNDDNNYPSGGDGFKPNLRFHSHESIDLHSIQMDGLRYVIPKHTLSDDTTDLIPGVYEGGLKVWECSIDLCRYIARVIDDDVPMDEASSGNNNEVDELHAAVRRSLSSGGSTMELGCGHGLPGCLILRENIRRSSTTKEHGQKDKADSNVVIFTDFNDFVLHHATIPNAQLNVCGLRRKDGVAMDEIQTAQALVQRSVFAGGDWMGLSHKLSTGDLRLPGTQYAGQPEEEAVNRLDLILASETTYTPESCEDTAYLMLRHLKIDVGVGLVATKRFYFGVGGGTDMFTDSCNTLSYSDQGPCSGLRLVVRTIQTYDTGNANIRDLLEVRCQRK